MTESKGVYVAMNKAQAMLAREGIAKLGTNQQHRYPFRRLDDVYNACSRIFSEVGLLIIPNVKSLDLNQGTTKSGGVSFHAKITVDWDFVSSHDGSKHTASTKGECIDTSDKATNKAFVSAYKYLLIVTFCIPLEGEQDADHTTPEAPNIQKKEMKPYPDKRFDEMADGWVEKKTNIKKLQAVLSNNGYALTDMQIRSLNSRMAS